MGTGTRRILLTALLLSCVSCSSSFEREWDTRRALAVAPSSFSGCWEGTWTSSYNAHTGALRAIISSVDDGSYVIRFHATYELLYLPLTYEYELPLTVKHSGDTYHFKGSADLGSLAGGVYEYDGSCRGDSYMSSYRASVDYGVFEMRRVYPRSD